MNHDDDALRRIISAADPAAHLTPLRDDQLARLSADAMQDRASSSPAAHRPAPRRRLLFGGLAGLGAVAAAALVLPLVLGTPTATVTALQQPASGGPAAMCAMVSPEAVAGADTAFQAAVTGIDGGMVTLDVERRFTGDPGATVTIPQGSDTEIDGAPIRFEDGSSYLIASRDGTVMTCGLSGADSPELRAVYDAAFR